MTVTTLQRTRATSRLALVALCALWAGSALAQAPLGGPAPDFSLTGSDEVVYTLSDGFGNQVQLLHMIGFA